MKAVTPAAAFFDVDETLISLKSMFSFLEYYLAQRGNDSDEYLIRSDKLKKMAASGVSRVDVNRSFYTNFAGEPVEEILDMGSAWHSEQLKNPNFYLDKTLDDLVRLRAAGTHIVLVSGSFQPCLEPIADAVGAHQAFGTELKVAGGRFTGLTGPPMIGSMKAVKLLDTARGLGISSADCVAYGDHASDLEMLLAAGSAVVVGSDPVLAEAAQVHGWPQIQH